MDGGSHQTVTLYGRKAEVADCLGYIYLRSCGDALNYSVPDPISCCIVGPCTCTETMGLNGYINICIRWQEFSNWFPIYSQG